MNKKGKSWPLFVVAILIVVFSLTAIFGVSYQYGDTKNVYIKGASDIRFGIDIRGGVDVTFMPAGTDDGGKNRYRGPSGRPGHYGLRELC